MTPRWTLGAPGDEYLYTSDVRVAAELLGRGVVQIRTDIGIRVEEGAVGVLLSVHERDDMPFEILDEDANCIYEADAIAIPLSTVRERCRAREGEPVRWWEEDDLDELIACSHRYEDVQGFGLSIDMLADNAATLATVGQLRELYRRLYEKES